MLLPAARILFLLFSFVLKRNLAMMMTYNLDKNISDVAIALAEIINGLSPKQLTILAPPIIHKRSEEFMQNYSTAGNNSNNNNKNNVEHLQKDVDDFIYRLHKLFFKSVIFYDIEKFFNFIEINLQGSIESVNLIFSTPYELSRRIQERKLSHRLSLFIFYWGAKYPPKAAEVNFAEPIRAVVITRPRQKAFRIYYNQAVPNGNSNLRLVNWYDGDNLGLQKIPILPAAQSVYSNFNGRVFRVPVFHSPPWFWVNYDNETSINNLTLLEDDFNFTIDEEFDEREEYVEVNVTGGRDHRLLCLLAEQMNFQFVYIDAPGRTQGSLRVDSEVNENFTGGIGLLQNGLADFLLGDVSLSWERRKAVEFSFFTLADSGAFATHAPRRLNEAFAIIRPFKKDVWPYLILTILFSGPIFYAIIATPYKWRFSHATAQQSIEQRDVEKVGELVFHMAYIKEITINTVATRKLLKLQMLQSSRATTHETQREMPPYLLDRCIWFTVQLFLKQSCQELYHGYRAKFLMIVYWIAATYVLADVYSAQLTSQFARPPHEAPINTLYRLQKVMLQDGYQLFVEKESSSLEMLENGTEIFRQLYALMKQQNEDEAGYLIDSVEAGIKLIADGLENKAVLGGRETLYFNMQQFGSKTFQLSHKLYTRYSAVAVQIGCPFLDSLNDVLIHLFEGGILDKMTNAEYATQSRMLGKVISNKQKKHLDNEPSGDSSGSSSSSNNNGISTASSDANANDDNNNNNNNIGKNNNDGNNNNNSNNNKQKTQDHRQIIQPLNLRMLQGAFIILFVGYGTATLILLLELLCKRLNVNLKNFLCKINLRCRYRCSCRKVLKIARIIIMRVLRQF